MQKYKVAFTLHRLGKWWTGGINYYKNLFSALALLPGRPIEPVVFVDNNPDEDMLRTFEPFLSVAPIRSSVWSQHPLRKASNIVIGKDRAVEDLFRLHSIDLVFQHFVFLGYNFGLPTLSWIADFQHRHLPQMFSTFTYLKRDIGYKILAKTATRILVSSRSAQQDCELFYPASRDKIAVLPFVVDIDKHFLSSTPHEIVQKYSLPEKYFYMPNQFWKHKNHISIINALDQLKKNGESLTVVASGNMQDFRNPSHPRQLMELVAAKNLEKNFISLGMIPHGDMLTLMRCSVAVINPSLFEGWSTTVEEAKSIGAPLILSDLPVHREQAGVDGTFFDPLNIDAIAAVLSRHWSIGHPGPHSELEFLAEQQLIHRRLEFARQFESIVNSTIQSYRPA